MKDVLANLAKLPPECAATIAGRKVYIRRGARDPIPLSTPITVDQWNAQKGVTEAQVAAMIVGVTLGWDMDGADPDTHADATGDQSVGDGPFDYRYQAEITLEITPLGYRTEELAAKGAQEALTALVDLLNENSPVGVIFNYGVSDTLTLVETNDPREI